MNSSAAAWRLALIVATLQAGSLSAGEWQRLTTDGLEKTRPVVAADGTFLVFARHEPDASKIWLQLLDLPDGSNLRRLTDRKTPEYNASISPDRATILYVAISQVGTQGNLDIAAIKTDQTDRWPVVGDREGKLSHQDWPSWSPDGKRLAFSSTHEGNQEIYTCGADGSDLVRVTQSPGIDAHPCWAPDGQTIVFATDRWGGLEIAHCRPDGGGVVRLTTSPGLDDYPSVSPDGQSIAFVSHRDGQFEVYLIDRDGSRPRNLSNHPARDTFPSWMPDGQAIILVSEREGSPDLYIRHLAP